MQSHLCYCAAMQAYHQLTTCFTCQHHHNTCMQCLATELCEQLPGREATDAELLRVHSPGLIAAVAALSTAGTAAELALIKGYLGEELLGSCGTHAAARVAAGTAAEVAGRVAKGEAAHAFAVIRPAGAYWHY